MHMSSIYIAVPKLYPLYATIIQIKEKVEYLIAPLCL